LKQACSQEIQVVQKLLVEMQSSEPGKENAASGSSAYTPSFDGPLLQRKMLTTLTWPNQDSNIAPCCNEIASIRMQTKLAVMVFHLNGQQVKDDPKVNVHLCACAPAENTTNYDGLAAVEIRGSSSARDHIRKSWALELRSVFGDDRSEPLLGVAPQIGGLLASQNLVISNIHLVLSFHCGAR
jgi:hypothetical protein